MASYLVKCDTCLWQRSSQTRQQAEADHAIHAAENPNHSVRIADSPHSSAGGKS